MLFIGIVAGLVAATVKGVAAFTIRTGLSAVGLGGRLAYGTYLNTVRVLVLLGRGVGAAGAPGGGLGGGGASRSEQANSTNGQTTNSDDGTSNANNTNPYQVDTSLPYQPIYQGPVLDAGVEYTAPRSNNMNWNNLGGIGTGIASNAHLTTETVTTTSKSTSEIPGKILNVSKVLNSKPLYSKPLQAPRWMRAMPQQTEEPGNPNSKYYPKRPYGSYWKNANKEYFQYTIKHQTNRDYYKITNPDGTVTYAYRTFDERFYYSEPNTNKWHRFKPDGYKTYAQQIESLKNIAAATSVFGEKYEALLQTIFYLLASLATGGPIGRIVFDVAYQIVSQFIQSRLRGEPFRVDYFDLMLDTIPIGYSAPKGIFLNIARDAIKMFFDLKNKEGLTQQTNINYIAQDTINSMVAVIINRYRARLFGSGLNVPEQELKDAVTKLITLLAAVFNIGVYEEKISGQ